MEGTFACYKYSSPKRLSLFPSAIVPFLACRMAGTALIRRNVVVEIVQR